MSIKNFSILVAIDGSESSMKAVDYAIELAKKQNNSRLTVLNIIDIDTPKDVLFDYYSTNLRLGRIRTT